MADDLISQVNALKSRIEKVRGDAATMAGRAQTLREQYGQQMQQITEKYGCKTLEELDEKIRLEEGALRDLISRTQRLLALYEAGDFDALETLAASQTPPAKKRG